MERFHGAITALVTPFIDGKIDEQGLAELIEFQIENGIHGIVPCGTTGESATLGYDEHKRVVELTVKTAAGRVPIIGGAGANDTAKAVKLAQSVQECGADAILTVAPYYNKPSQEGLFQHFKAVAESVDIPIFLYNVPGRTVVHIMPETIARLADIPNIAGVKEACASLEQISDVIRFCPDDFIILSGDDFTSMPTVFIGGKGVISVVSNVDPGGMARTMEAALAGNVAAAQNEHYRLFSMMKLMFACPSPAPAKKALELMGRMKDSVPRLPMTKTDEATTEALRKELTSLGLI